MSDPQDSAGAVRDRMPPLAAERLTDAQRMAAAELASGPRGGVRGPFIPLLRSPELMRRLQKVGEYLRYECTLERRLGELAILITSRQWTQQFEWRVHVPLAREAGLAAAIVDALAAGCRPRGMAADEEIVYDVCDEVFRTHGVSEATYQRAVAKLGEQALIDLLGTVGYFTTVSMVMNVAHTPAPEHGTIAPLAAFPR
jgi:4-carboxymuconolactone decarboxylase